jgi:glycolate oxidase iron-sulfur subunit
VSGFAGLAPCVHCGFCLQSCPTYLATGDEADGPRGRIVLMRALARGDLAPLDPGVLRHLDRCLGCRGCEPVCPSGVVYGPALELAREQIARDRPIPSLARAVLAVMAQRALRAPALVLARAVRPLAALAAGRGRAGFAAGMLAATRPWKQERQKRQGWQKWQQALPPDGPATPAPPAPPAVVFTGCIQSGLFSHVNAAAARTLAANGYTIAHAPRQECCGALHAHAGLLDEARVLARANVAAFAEVPETTVAATAAGCGAMLKSYGELLAGEPIEDAARAFAARVRDVTELLAEAGPRRGGALPLRVAYDPPCHLLHAQGIDQPPRHVLAAIPELEITPHDEAELCCGSAGIYSLLEPGLSRIVLDRKIAALAAARPDVVATGNPGCAMQIGAGLRAAGYRIGIVHPVELLDRSYVTGSVYGPPGVHSPDP